MTITAWTCVRVIAVPVMTGAAFVMGSGVAVASADLNSTTCTTDQIMAAGQATEPDMWNQLTANPTAMSVVRSELSNILAIPAGQREPTIQQVESQYNAVASSKGLPPFSDTSGPMVTILNNCQNY